MSNNTAKFRFSGYQILKSNIEIKDPNNISDNLDIKFKRSSGVNEIDNKYKLDIDIIIQDENNNLIVEATCNGFFEFDKNITDKEKNVFFNTSAPAILFPYIRAYISTLTTLSGMRPIILPTINLTQGAVNDKEKED